MVNHLDPSTNWPHQRRGREGLARARAAGIKAIVGVAPCGSGKSRVMFQEAYEEVTRGGRVTILTHRAMLFVQMARQLRDLGMDYGLIAAETGIKAVDLERPIQLASIQTLYSWAVKRPRIDLPESTLVLIDEAHANRADMTRALLYGSQDDATRFDGFLARGAVVIGFTGTPVNLGGLYEGIVSFGSYKELRGCKAHLPVVVYSPSEMDVSGLKANSEGEFSERELERRAESIIGDVFEWWRKLNPFAEPALLFAPSVASSRWFAHEWIKRGVSAAHIGSDVCLVPKRLPCGSLALDQVPTDADVRQSILDGSQSGEIKVVCNRFILREAIDMPWIRHGIAATVFGGLATYLQSVGRIQRYFDAYPDKIWQDHGGNFWRHGSPNIERTWRLGDTNRSLAQARKEQVAQAERPEDVEGICCPKCAGWRRWGSECPHCGHTHQRSVRRVRMLDGQLKMMTGTVIKKKREPRKKTADDIWLGVLYGSIQAGRPVSSAVAIFYSRCAKAGVEADASALKFAPPPPDSLEWHYPVSDVFPQFRPRGGKR